MKLKNAKRLCDGIVALYAIAFVLLYLAPDFQKKCLCIALIVLTAALLFVNLAFLRCPYCRAQIHRWGMNFCPKCGKKLED